jgi:hypothetical protein
MPQRRWIGLLVGVSVLLLGAGAAWAQLGPGSREVVMTDDCEPVSFNAAIGPGTCVGNGTTTFGQFIQQLVSTGEAPEWRFDPVDVGLRSGRGLLVHNTGGEFHTYTEVAAFGGGCIAALNDILGLTPVPECEPEVAPGVPLAFVTTGANAGESVELPGLASGTHLFMCLIHPWMRSTVRVRPR